MAMFSLKKFVNDITEMIEDFFTALLAFVLFVFLIGVWYGQRFAGQPQLWYPLYLLIGLLLMKLGKDMFFAKHKPADKKK